MNKQGYEIEIAGAKAGCDIDASAERVLEAMMPVINLDEHSQNPSFIRGLNEEGLLMWQGSPYISNRDGYLKFIQEALLGEPTMVLNKLSEYNPEEHAVFVGTGKVDDTDIILKVGYAAKPVFSQGEGLGEDGWWSGEEDRPQKTRAYYGITLATVGLASKGLNILEEIKWNYLAPEAMELSFKQLAAQTTRDNKISNFAYKAL